MWHTKTITTLTVVLLIAGCSQNHTRSVELRLPVSPTLQTPAPQNETAPSSQKAALRHHPDDLLSNEAAPADLWDRVRRGFRLLDNAPDTLPNSLSWYEQRQYHMDRVAELSSPYLYFVLEEVEKRGMPSEIALLPIVESDYRPFAYSRSGAAGIWQFIPSTGENYGLVQNAWYDGRRDIYTATHAALDFLQDLHDRLNNDWLLALAAYNSGGTTVERAIKTARRNGKSGDFWSIRSLLPRETRHYIPKLLAISAIVKEPQRHNIVLKKIPNEPRITHITIEGRISLQVAARLAGLSIHDFRQLNPAFNYLMTPPDGPHHLMLPVDSAASFKWRLAQLDPGERLGQITHTVSAGESLSTIASQYDTTVVALKRANDLRGSLIYVGDELNIPVAGTTTLSGTIPADTTHTVSDGDTLWGLARRYRVTISQLEKWNALTTGQPLMPGQQLIVLPRNPI